MFYHPRRLLTVFILCALVCPLAPAQVTTSNLSGTVIDERDAAVGGARITLLNTSTGFQRETRTNSNGYFILSLLEPGNYTLIAEMPGFSAYTIEDVTINASINSSVEIILRPKPVFEEVTVEAGDSASIETSRIDITNAAIKYSVSNEQVISLPVLTTTLGRNTLGVLSFLIPGVSPSSAVGSAQADTNRRGNQMSINGSRSSSVAFNLEGGDNNDHEFSRSASPFPNPDALQEFTIVTNSYQADLGRSSGGIINAVAKSGSSRLKGNLRYFLINEAFNARGFFDSAKPRDRVSTFGGQAGGPVKLPRVASAFFFFDYEGARASRETLSTILVPTSRERAGDFSLSPVRLSDPANILTGTFPNNIIPQSRINPIARLYLDKFIPLPNSGENLFRQMLPTDFENDQVTARLDKKLTQSDNLSATYFFIRSDVQSGAETFPVGSKVDSSAVNHNLILRETHLFSPRTVNQLTVALTRLDETARLFAPGASRLHPREFGFTGVRPQSSESMGAPSVTISNTGVRISTGGGSASAKTTWQIKDDLSHTSGNHALKFGAEIRGYLQDTINGSNNGSFSFTGLSLIGTRHPVGDFLLGIPSSYTQTSGNERNLRHRAYYFYAMDDWRARPNFTVSLGLRYELSPPFTDKLDQISVFRPGSQSRRFPNAPRGILFVSDPDPVLGTVPRGGYRADLNDFAPRAGIAFSPQSKRGWLRTLFGEGRTALRIGGGMFYDQTYGFSFSQASLTQPFSVLQILSWDQMRSAGGSFANPFGRGPNPWPIDLRKGLFTGTPTIQPFDPSFRTAYSVHYNFILQRELPWSLLIEAAYVGNSSLKLNRERELNFALLTRGARYYNVDSRRIYRQFSRIPSQESTGRARYDSFQLRAARRFQSGLRFDLSYVRGKSLDDGSGPVSAFETDPFSWARSSFDRRHNFVFSYTYALPETKLGGVLGSIANGWQLSGITEIRSGIPIDISQTNDPTLTGRVFSRLGRPDIIGDFTRLDPRQQRTITVRGVRFTGHFLFDPRAFRPVDVQQIDETNARAGSLGRNMFDGPGINLTSLSIIKKFALSESQRLTLRADIRNLFNRAHFLPDSHSVRVDDPLFGQVSSSAPGRNVQLSLRYNF
jgi:outer membrane receptor protein involved in Fe transport